VYGGRSGEHEVSLASAASVFAEIDRKRYDPVPIRIEKDGQWMLADKPPAAPSAADVIDQARSEPSRARNGREVLLPPRPGEDTLLLITRQSKRDDDIDAATALTGLGLDVMFPVLHGPYGEDGTIQGLFEMANIAYVGCGVLASATGMDKVIAKMLFHARGLRSSEWRGVSRREWRANRDGVIASLEDALPFPVFVKPANLGSSVGITKVHNHAELAPALDVAADFDRKIIIEAAVPDAREIECSVLGNDHPEASLPGEVIPAREFYDYDAKYLDAASRTEIPAKLDPSMQQEVRRQAIVAYQAIDATGLARVDFLLSKSSGELFINEINTLPGFTTISMFTKMWEATGVPYRTLIDRLIALAIERHAEKQELKTSAF